LKRLNRHHYDRRSLEQLFERRTFGRTKILKRAKLFFNAQREPIDCGVRDVTNAGAGIRADGLNIIPVSFELSFDNFLTVRKCCLIWRNGDFLGVAFKS
jgi:hypothetical protein